MYNRSRGEALAVGAELRHERGLFFGRREGRLDRIAREEDALVRGEAALARGRVVASIAIPLRRAMVSISLGSTVPSMCKWSSAFGKPATNLARVASLALMAAAWSSVR